MVRDKKGQNEKMKAILMTVTVLLVAIAFIAQGSAYSIDGGNVVCGGGLTTWTFTVSCNSLDDRDVSNFIVGWCDEDAVKEVWVGSSKLDRDEKPEGWDYGTFEKLGYSIRGIKIDYQVNKGESFLVTIILDDEYCSSCDYVVYQIKAGEIIFSDPPGSVYGPKVCDIPIPEFSTIAIPIASMLGLLFFINGRKRRDEE